MRKIFADTGYWIALLNPADDLHQKARHLTISIKNVPIIKTEVGESLIIAGWIVRSGETFPRLTNCYPVKK